MLHVICIGMYAITTVRVSGKSKGLGWRCSTTSNKGDRISAYLALTPVETRWTGLVFWYLNTRRLGVMHSKRVLRWYSSFVPSLDRERSSLFCSPLKQVACVFAQHAEETKQNKKKTRFLFWGEILRFYELRFWENRVSSFTANCNWPFSLHSQPWFVLMSVLWGQLATIFHQLANCRPPLLLLCWVVNWNSGTLKTMVQWVCSLYANRPATTNESVMRVFSLILSRVVERLCPFLFAPFLSR